MVIDVLILKITNEYLMIFETFFVYVVLFETLAISVGYPSDLESHISG
jgi:hypothetical protein